MTPTHLKLLSNGRVFLYTKNLADRGDMVACDASGAIATGHIADAGETDASKRRKTKFLGNKVNGVLYPYTEYLAELDNMISIDTEEQWIEMKEIGQAAEQHPDTVAPKLERTTPPAPVPVPAAETKPQFDTPDTTSLPPIEGLGPREAKTVLSEWAMNTFNHKVDRRPSLESVIAECRGLLAGTTVTAAG